MLCNFCESDYTVTRGILVGELSTVTIREIFNWKTSFQCMQEMSHKITLKALFNVSS